MMKESFVKDPYIRVLLERRDEIKNEMNKLQAEYQAIGELITRDYRHRNSMRIDEEREL